MDVMVPSETECYKLTPDQTVYSAVFKLNLGDAEHTAFFAQHVPTEFERSAHYFIDEHGRPPESGCTAASPMNVVVATFSLLSGRLSVHFSRCRCGYRAAPRVA